MNPGLTDREIFGMDEILEEFSKYLARPMP
jgi:hypothetical protein